MLDISVAGLIGAIVGTVVAGVNYHLFIGVLERWMREREQTLTAEERDTIGRQAVAGAADRADRRSVRVRGGRVLDWQVGLGLEGAMRPVMEGARQ